MYNIFLVSINQISRDVEEETSLKWLTKKFETKGLSLAYQIK